MKSIKANIAHLLLLTFLVVFGFETISYSFSNLIWQDIKLSEAPFDAEEEEEKSKKEKEWADKVVSTYESIGYEFNPLLDQFRHSLLYCSIPREIVTPPPEFRL